MSPEEPDGDPTPPPSFREVIDAVVAGLQQIGKNVRTSIETVQRSELVEQFQRGARWWVEDVAVKAAGAMAQMLEAYEWMMPPNWRALTVPDAVGVSDLMWREGWGLAWVPSPSVLRRLLAAPDIEARKFALLGMEGEVLADLGRALAGAKRERLAGLVLAAREVVETYRSGHWMAAQALAAASLSTVIHAHFGLTFGEAKRMFERTADPEEQELLEWRMDAVTGAIRRALDDYKPMVGEAAPHFNRHATAHRVEAPQYSEANSLSAAMLLVCVVCELEWIAATIERQERLDDAP